MSDHPEPMLNQDELADALELAARLVRGGMSLEAVYAAEHGLTVLGTEAEAARWRAHLGDRIGGHPLYVVAVAPIGASS